MRHGVDVAPHRLLDRRDESGFGRFTGLGELALVAGTLPSLEEPLALGSRPRIALLFGWKRGHHGSLGRSPMVAGT